MASVGRFTELISWVCFNDAELLRVFPHLLYIYIYIRKRLSVFGISKYLYLVILLDHLQQGVAAQMHFLTRKPVGIGQGACRPRPKVKGRPKA